MKFLIVSMGSGETAQGVSVGKYILKQGQEVEFALILEENLTFLDDIDAKKMVISADPEELKTVIASNGYDCVILCNSKMFKDQPNFRNIPPSRKPLAVSIDSNWLFRQDSIKYPVVKWLDRFFVCFPDDIFKSGLKENGGNFEISSSALSKITCIGFIPSTNSLDQSDKEAVRQSLGLSAKEKLIFVYFGSGVNFREIPFEKYRPIFNQLHKEVPGFKVMMIGNQRYEQEWAVNTDLKASASMFEKYLSSADLVIQHQGMGTLVQSICAGVPVIANTIKPDEFCIENAHAWEVEPFVKQGVCSLHYYSDKDDTIISTIKSLLEGEEGEKMIGNQKVDWEQGEKKLYDEVLRSLNDELK